MICGFRRRVGGVGSDSGSFGWRWGASSRRRISNAGRPGSRAQPLTWPARPVLERADFAADRSCCITWLLQRFLRVSSRLVCKVVWMNLESLEKGATSSTREA